ncbi:hypothetical protein LTR46_011047 [Exophiala xenobiotica]|nr:hypothetical protein LTR46_011047 [Exophiala xenobiotica]
MPVGRRAELSSKAGTSGFRTFLYRHTKTVSQKYPTMPVYPPSLQTPSVERKPPPAFDTTELGQRSPSGAVQNNSYQEEAAIGLLEGLDPWFTNPGGPLELITRLYEESQRHSLSSPDDLELAHSTSKQQSTVTTREDLFTGSPIAQFDSELSEGISECFSTDCGSKCLGVSEPHSVLSRPMGSPQPLMSWSKPLLQSQQPNLDGDSGQTCCSSDTWTALPQGKGIIFDNWAHDQENFSSSKRTGSIHINEKTWLWGRSLSSEASPSRTSSTIAKL